jgi:hypothetical protein
MNTKFSSATPGDVRPNILKAKLNYALQLKPSNLITEASGSLEIEIK